MRSALLSVLRGRRLLAAATAESLDGVLAAAEAAGRGPPAIYAGFDPTAPALHVGHLPPVLVLAHAQRLGFRPIALVGGATGRIGDPSGRRAERPLLDESELEANVAGLQRALRGLLDFDDGPRGALLLDNHAWFGRMSCIDLLRDVGRHFRVGTMLGKESVRSRIESSQGMSFTELSYQLLQGYDFLHLHREHNCVLQAGGSDQWGNIVAGTDLVRKAAGAEVHGITVPLVVSPSGEKLGKSAGNAVWLDPALTPPFRFYQYFVQVPDEVVEQYLLMLTMLDGDEIDAAMERHRAKPELLEAQRLLATTVTRAIHGGAAVESAQQMSAVLYGKRPLRSLSGDEIRELLGEFPVCQIARREVLDLALPQLLVRAQVCPSTSQARKLLAGGGFSVNNERVAPGKRQLDESDLIDGVLVVLRRGKRNYTVIECTS